MPRIISRNFIWTRLAAVLIYTFFGVMAMLVVDIYIANPLITMVSGPAVSALLGAFNLFEPKYDLG